MAPGGTSFEPGARLGPYELQEELGHGGMGAVYRARDTRLHRDVAVKVLRAGLGENADRLRRFEQEARTVAQLHHTNVLAIFDVGAEDGTPYLVMELLEGETLQSRLKRGPLRPHEALDTARQLARGLAAAHAREILHRDLKPANVFLTRDGLVKVLDFGLAKLMVEQPRMDDAEAPTRNLHTGSGVIMGTVGYLSPEQIRGQGADSRSDIFAFGCVLWEMCVGEAPFQGASDVEVMHAILKDEPRAERSHPIVPGGVDAILSHCLEKDPAFRFQSAQDLLFALEATTAATQGSDASTQTLLRPRSGPNSAAPPSPTARRGWQAAALLAAGVALGGALAALALWPRKVDIPEIRGITFSGLDDSPSASPDGRTIAFSSWRDGHPRIWLKQLDTGSEAALTGGSDTLPRFSRDGATLLFVRNEPEGSSLYRVPALGGEARKLVSNAVAGDFSPDGRNVAWIRWVHEGGVITSILGVATRSGAKPRPVARFSGVALTAPRWSPDGAQIAVTSGGTVGQTSAFRARIYLANPENGRTKEIVPPSSAGTLSSVAWISPQALLFCQSETVNQAAGSSGRVYRLDLPSGAMEAILATPSSLSLDLLSGGRLIFDARSPKENLREFPVAGGAPAWITKGNSTDRQPVFAPDGRWVLFTSNRGGNMDPVSYTHLRSPRD